VVYGKRSMLDKMPGDAWQKFANLRLLYGYMFAHPGKKLLFMGADVAQWNEWNYQSSVEWNLLDFLPHKQANHCLASLNHLYRSIPELHEIDFSWEGFEWIDFHDSDQSTVSFLRKTGNPDKEHTACVFNFTPVPRTTYRLGVPSLGYYREIFNSDAADFGGGNVVNGGGVMSENVPWMGQPCSIVITLPPLAAVWFRYEG